MQENATKDKEDGVCVQVVYLLALMAAVVGAFLFFCGTKDMASIGVMMIIISIVVIGSTAVASIEHDALRRSYPQTVRGRLETLEKQMADLNAQ